jgi:Fic family protein
VTGVADRLDLIVDAESFEPNAPGRLVTLASGAPAFVPAPLPPRLDLPGAVVRLLAEASRKLGHLAGVIQNLPNPEILIRPLLRREAVLSSRIEGTVATEGDLVLFDISPVGKPEKPDVREVANYLKAFHLGLKRLHELPLCLRLLREIHGELMRDVRGAERSPGEFRTTQNYIGKPGRVITEARFVPPPPSEMQEALEQLERFLNAGHGLDPLLEAALVHYQFETIHPFADGNGRIGRLLISLLLTARNVLTQPVLNLSAYFERHRQEYLDHLLRVSQRGAWVEWIEFFLEGVAEESADGVERSQRLLDLWRDYRARFQQARGSARALELVDRLFASPAVTAPLVAKQLGVTFRSGQAYIRKLERLGILREITGFQRNRVYLAPGILAATSDAAPG